MFVAGSSGKIEASTTKRPRRPNTAPSASTTVPIRHVDVGWYTPLGGSPTVDVGDDALERRVLEQPVDELDAAGQPTVVVVAEHLLRRAVVGDPSFAVGVHGDDQHPGPSRQIRSEVVDGQQLHIGAAQQRPGDQAVRVGRHLGAQLELHGEGGVVAQVGADVRPVDAGAAQDHRCADRAGAQHDGVGRDRRAVVQVDADRPLAVEAHGRRRASARSSIPPRTGRSA